MNKTLLKIGCLVLTLVAFASCGHNDGDNKKKEGKNTTAGAGQKSYLEAGALPNIAYVDMDSLLSNYNLAIDYNDQMVAKQSALSREQQNQYNAIQKQQETMQKKMQNGQYSSEAEVRQDQKTLENLQANAEKKLTALQEELQKLMITSNEAVQDSIQNFIDEYNEKKHYTVIFQKAATLYIDPALDITNEVIEGLNARYNKIK